MKFILFFSVLFFYNLNSLSAQEDSHFKFGEVSLRDFIIPESTAVDGNTSGVFIADIGSTYFIGNKYHSFSCVHKRHMRIKIINNIAFSLATLNIRLYGEGDYKDELSYIKAAVYNIENGKVVESEISKEDIFENKLNPYTSEKKMTVPAVKAGSIIEYTYTITSRNYVIPSWYFQHEEYPCLYSEFEVVFPDVMRYIISRYGSDSFYIDKTSQVNNNNYTMNEISIISNDLKHTWAMKNIPAFKAEKFIYSPVDYLDKLDFTPAMTLNGNDLNSLGTTWEAVNNNLLNSAYFGLALDLFHSSNLFNTVEKLTSSDLNLTEAARHLYSYVRDNFTCIPDNDIFVTSDLYDINKKKKGSVEELNMLLIALLRQKGINADPVILSTREYGKNPAVYPMLEKMNYLICMTVLTGDTVYLDASRPDLAFGRLPQDCYNGHARIISKNGGSLYFSIRGMEEQKTTVVFITNEGKGKLTGSCESSPGFFETEDLRKDIKESGIKKYFDDIRSGYAGDIDIYNTGIDSLHQPEFPVKAHFGFAIPATDDILYFNPFVMTEYKQNPFQSEQRKYPVSLSFPIDNLYILNMEIPDGYVADELPKSAKIYFNEDQGTFEYGIQVSKNNIQFRSRIRLKEVFFSAEDYQSLRNFFNFIVKKYNEQIVFKKKK